MLIDCMIIATPGFPGREPQNTRCQGLCPNNAKDIRKYCAVDVASDCERVKFFTHT